MRSSPLFRHLLLLSILVFQMQLLAGTNLSETYELKSFSRQDGLPSDLVHTAFMDHQGFTWLGTHKGLVRWDGHEFVQQTLLVQDSIDISKTIIYDLLEDHNGLIWIGTIGNGLLLYDPINHNVKRLQDLVEDPERIISISEITSLLLDDDGGLWYGTFTQGLNYFNKRTKEAIHIPLSESYLADESFKKNTVHSIIEDISNEQVLWLAADNGLYRFHKKSHQLDHFPSTAPETSLMSCHSLWMEDAKTLWVGTYGGGVVRFQTENQHWSYAPFDQETWDKRSALDNIILSLIPKSDTEFWVNSFDRGPGIFNKIDKSYHFFGDQLTVGKQLQFQQGRNVYVDPLNQVWVFDYKAGIGLLAPKEKLFEYQPLNLGDCWVFDTKGIRDFEYDPIRELTYIVGKACDGFYILDANLEFVQQISTEGLEGAYNVFNTVLVDHAGNVWVGGEHIRMTDPRPYQSPSFYKLNQETQQLQMVDAPFIHDAKIQQKDIHVFFEDQQKRLWIGMEHNELVNLDWKNKELKSYRLAEYFGDPSFEDGEITGIVQIKDGQLLLSSSNKGLIYFDLKTTSFRLFKEEMGYDIAINNQIYTIAEGASGRLWFASYNQFQVFNDPAKSYFSDGILTSQISSLLEDQAENLWVATEDGLYYYDDKVPHFPIRFGRQDGLKDDFFHNYPLYEHPNGALLIGQSNGFGIYRSNKSAPMAQEPNIAFTKFNVFQDDFLLDKEIQKKGQLKLSHRQNFLTIGFVLLGITNQERTQLSYFLDGVDADWNHLKNESASISYANLAPGKYTFHVQGRVFDGTWELKQKKIEIIISTPWWKTWGAYSLYLFLFLALVFGIYRFQLKRNLIRLEAIRLRELDAFKTTFYTNITHEFRTPLTVILGMSERIKQEPDRYLEDGLKSIDRNGSQLLNLVNQMLDLSKLDSNQLQLKYVEDDIIQFLKYTFALFESYAVSKEITMNFVAEEKTLFMDFDPDKLTSVVVNLLNNAIKFTSPGGNVSLKISKDSSNEELTVEIKDTGIGIPASELDAIFNRFYQTKGDQSRLAYGTGIGLALVKELVHLMDGTIKVKSVVGKGSTFGIQFPIRNRAERRFQEKIGGIQHKWLQVQKQSSELESGTPDGTNADNPSILVVDDNPDIIEYIFACLDTDFHLDYALDGAVGIEKAISTIPDIIISDVMMPRKDGYTLVETLKNDARTSHIPIILLTAKADRDSKLEGLQRGADEYLPKPFDKKELVVRIKNLIQIRMQLQNRYQSLESIKLGTEQKYKQEDEFIIRFKKLLEEHIDETDYGVPELCLALGVSRAQLYRKIKALTGLSVALFIRKIRLEKAKELLNNSSQNITEIAYDVGFNNLTYFSKVFKEEFGKTPSEMRNV